MKRTSIIVIGFIVAILGTAGLVFERVPVDRDTAVLDLGQVEASATVQEEEEIPPLLAGGVLVLGLGMVAYGAIRD